jgi:hypothetical protein
MMHIKAPGKRLIAYAGCVDECDSSAKVLAPA